MIYKTQIIALSLLASLSAVSAEEYKLRAFETDGCTMFVEGPKTRPDLWKHCCISHDLRYWVGGTNQEMDEADVRLKLCVQKVAGPSWARLIYSGVRAGHYSPIKNKYQWAWAWTPKRTYLKVSEKDLETVIAELKSMNIPEVDMEAFIKENFPISK